MTFGDYAATWLEQTGTPHRKERATSYYRQIIDNRWTATFGRLAVTDIKPATSARS